MAPSGGAVVAEAAINPASHNVTEVASAGLILPEARSTKSSCGPVLRERAMAHSFRRSFEPSLDGLRHREAC